MQWSLEITYQANDADSLQMMTYTPTLQLSFINIDMQSILHTVYADQ